jgi:hypothetical protein
VANPETIDLDRLDELLRHREKRVRLAAAAEVIGLTLNGVEKQIPPELRGRWVRLLIRALRARGQGAVVRALGLEREAREWEREYGS